MIARSTSSSRRLVWFGCLVALFGLGLVVPANGRAAVAPAISPLDRELDGPGANVDDACFWPDPENPSGTLLFVTVKDSHFVEVFNLASGALVTTIPGFGRPNNCVVEGDLLLTTDGSDRDVKIHHLPDFAFVGSFGADMGRPEGIDVLTTSGGAHLVYVTDSSDASVHVYDLATRAFRFSFPTGFGEGIEPIFVDDRLQRVFVARGDGEAVRGVGVFGTDGTLDTEFGSGVFAKAAEGLALYACGDRGYLLGADKLSSATEFKVFDRQTLGFLGTFRLEDGTGDYSNATDGLDLLQSPVPGFPNGVLATCDGCGSLPDEMDVVSWDRIAAAMRLDLCAGGLPADCVTTPCTEQVLATDDAFVVSAAPDTNFGTAPALEAETDDSTGLTESLLRFTVPSVVGFVERVTLRLTVAGQSGSDSNTGGVLYATSGPWTESGVTFATRPQVVGSPIAGAGAVVPFQTVDFDVTSAVHGPGTYGFTLRTLSADKVRYQSRESSLNPPRLLLSVRGGNPPSVYLTAPANGETLLTANRTVLRATAADFEDGDLGARIQWTSSLDGALGTGATLVVPSLSAGTHVLTATAVDRSGATDSASVTVEVRSRILTFPAIADTSVLSDAPDAAFGSATELATDLTPLRLAYLRFQVEGMGRFAVEQVRLRLTVSGNSGAESRSGGTVYSISDNRWAESTTTYNDRPSIDGPALSSQGAVARSQVVEFDVTPAVGSDGLYSFALSTAVNDAVKYRSREASTGAPQLVVTMTQNHAPLVTIRRPASGATVPANTAVTLDGSATDAEDGDLDAAIVWTSSLDGPLGTGGSLNLPSLSPGEHTVVASITDSGGRHGSASISLTVNANPTVNVTPEVRRLEPQADAYVASRLPRRSFGTKRVLRVQQQRRAQMLGLLRFVVAGTEGMQIERATLQLTPRRGRGTAAAYRAAETGWLEQEVTYPSRPPMDGPALATGALIRPGRVVELDVTSAIRGDGPVTLAVTTSRRLVDFYSREATKGRPTLVLLLRPAGGR
jgi:hypothetical protein